MATLTIYYNQMPSSDTGPGDPPIIIATQDELTAFVDEVSAETAGWPCGGAVIEVTITEDPYGLPYVEAGIGSEVGFVRYNGNDALRATLGDPAVTDKVNYSMQGHEFLAPGSWEVPMATVRAALAAFLEHGGLIPADFTHLPVATVDLFDFS